MHKIPEDHESRRLEDVIRAVPSFTREPQAKIVRHADAVETHAERMPVPGVCKMNEWDGVSSRHAKNRKRR